MRQELRLNDTLVNDLLIPNFINFFVLFIAVRSNTHTHTASHCCLLRTGRNVRFASRLVEHGLVVNEALHWKCLRVRLCLINVISLSFSSRIVFCNEIGINTEKCLSLCFVQSPFLSGRELIKILIEKPQVFYQFNGLSTRLCVLIHFVCLLVTLEFCERRIVIVIVGFVAFTFNLRNWSIRRFDFQVVSVCYNVILAS